MTKIEHRIANLLRLAAGNSNVNEAAAAFAAAQAYADRHAIDLEALRIEHEESGGTLDAPEPAAEITRIVVDTFGKKRIGWRCNLACVVAQANGCKTYTEHGGGPACVLVYGPADRLPMVKTLYHWIAAEVDRLGRAYARGRGRSAGTSFRMGAVHEVHRRLDEEREKTLQAAKTEAYSEGGEAALVRMSTAIARQDRTADLESYEGEQLNLSSDRGFSSGTSVEAYAAGRVAGRSVSTKPRGQLGAEKPGPVNTEV